MMNRIAILLLVMVSFVVFGGISKANETDKKFYSRLSQLNDEIRAIDGGTSVKGTACEARLTILINEFPDLYLQNYVCEPDSNGTAQIMLRQW
ncbi:MAG: hypothetical protein K9G26_05515 [Emcibacter sp.]|nr:hypothetical protein [Emcibacter sp.]